MEDLISRQAAKDAHCRICLDRLICYRSKEHCEDLKVFDALPSVKPKKVTNWVSIDDFPHEDWECNNCGWVVTTETPYTDYKYCPNCSSKMMEEGE